MIKAIKSIYVAGKMQDDHWRRKLFDPYPRSDSDHAHQLGYNPVTVSGSFWPANTDPETGDPYSGDYGTGLICGLAYTGPFFVDVCGGHGYSYYEDEQHGSNITDQDGCHHGISCSCSLEAKRSQVQAWCLDAIKRADLIFAWIDCIDCYGTIAEIGYAKALGKIIWIAGPRRYSDLWFVYQMADEVQFATRHEFGNDPNDILRGLLNSYLKEYCRLHPRLDSPIEQAFWDTWIEHTNNSVYCLEPQHPIGKYRVDFAHVPSMTAIELDGFASHSSTEDIANDRRRQRWIEEQGWHVVRFGGKEVHSDVEQCAQEVYQVLAKRDGERRKSGR